MVLSSRALLIVDGTMKIYEYHENTVAMLQWLEGTLPQDIHELSPVNRGELCDPNSDQIIVIALKEEPVQLQQYGQYSDFPQGMSFMPGSLTFSNSEFLPLPTRYARTDMGRPGKQRSC